ncbi:MAG: insulinase family protein [Lentisphaeria bacterium]|nr:insulinase family protein [Lentisphaeria bacterium]
MKKKIITAVVAGIFLFPALSGKSIMKTGTDKNGRSYQYATQDPFNLRIYKLKNGLTVYLSSNPAEPSVNIMTIVKAGAMDEPEHSTGLAHYLEHMMFKGTDRIGALNWEKERPLLEKLEQLFEERRKTSDPAKQAEIYREIDRISAEAAQYASPGEFAKITDSMGGSGLNAATSYNYTNYVVKIPSAELEKFLLLETERFRNPVLRLFHTELETVYEEFNRSQDNDYRKSQDAVLGNLFPGHPIGRSIIGLPEHIKLPSMKDTMEFYRKFYVPSNMAIIMSGDLDHDSTVEMLERTLGTLPAKPAPEHKVYRSTPLTESKTVTVTGNDAEHFRISCKIPLTPENSTLANLLTFLLCDNGYGILDQNLVRSRKLLNAMAYSLELRDQIIFMLAGSATEGQTLEEAAELLIRELKNVEEGKFEDWRIRAVAENLRVKLAEMKSESSGDLNDELAMLFLSGNSYADYLNIPDNAEKVTKEQLAEFIRTYFKNLVTVYKKNGKPEQVVKVEKPPITPVKLKSGETTEFARNLMQKPSGKTLPEELVQDQVLQRKQLSSGRELIRITKDFNDGLFRVQLLSPRGKYHDKRIEFALGYLEFLGTNKYSAGGLRQEFYKLGMKMSTDTTPHYTAVEISGPTGKYAEALALFNHFLRDMKPDQEVLQSYISFYQKGRDDTKKNPFQNFLQTVYYGWYGPDNPFADVLKKKELEALKAEELVALIRSLFSENSAKFLYSGDLPLETAAAEAEKLPAIAGKPVPPRPFYPVRKPQKPTIWFVEYEKVQLSIGLLTSGNVFNPEDMAFEELINEYFFRGLDAVVFQEIRESRALAYSASGGYLLQKEKGYAERTYVMAETQNDKAIEAIRAAKELLANMPFYSVKFQAAKQSVLKKLASERKLSFAVYHHFAAAERAGLNGDWRKALYQKISRMDEAAFRKLAAEKLSASVYDLIITGKPDEALLKELSQFGEVKKLTPEQIFGY